MTKTLPFESPFAPPEPEIARRWMEELDRLGVENVRIRLATSDAGSRGALLGLGREQMITKGFAEDWLRYRLQNAASMETVWRWATILVAAIAAIAAVVAAAPIVRSWF